MNRVTDSGNRAIDDMLTVSAGTTLGAVNIASETLTIDELIATSGTGTKGEAFSLV